MFDAKKLLDSLVAGSTQRAATPDNPGGAGVLGRLFEQLQKGAEGAGLEGGPGEMAKQVLGRAGEGVRDAAGRVDQSTGAGKAIEDIVRQISGGKSSADLIAKAKDMIAKNPGAAGAFAGVLGGLLLGTSGGRGLTAGAAKLGGLVLIGGLAYKAYQNSQAGKPVLAGTSGLATAAPAGSGFEASAQSSEAATLYIRAMIAAAAADGIVDAAERSRILGGLAELGIEHEASQFLASEFAAPASIEALAGAARTAEMRAQTYAAARLAIDPDSPAERDWLRQLASRLSLDAKFVAHLDEAANASKA